MNILPAAALLALAVSALATPAATGQDIECGPDDHLCLQRHAEIACREKPSSRASCEAWLHRLEAHPHASEIEWRVAAGWVYMFLADFATLTALDDFGAVTEDEAANFRSAASAIFNAAVISAPDNPNALGSLAVITEDLQTRIELEKRVVAADPSNAIFARTLADDLVSLKGSAGYLEAAEVVAAAYSHATAIPLKWHLARSAMDWYELGGNTRKSAALNAAIASEIKLDDAENEFHSLADADEKIKLIGAICETNIIALFDGGPCLRLVRLGQDELLQENAGHSIQYAEGLALIMSAASYALQANPDTAESFKNNIAELIAAGYESALVYDAYANFLAGAEMQAALAKAVSLDAHAGEIRYRLAMIYLGQGMRRQAIEQFEIARADLPEWRHEILDHHVKLARTQLQFTPEP